MVRGSIPWPVAKMAEFLFSHLFLGNRRFVIIIKCEINYKKN
jgi:hypothetical protein